MIAWTLFQIQSPGLFVTVWGNGGFPSFGLEQNKKLEMFFLQCTSQHHPKEEEGIPKHMARATSQASPPLRFQVTVIPRKQAMSIPVLPFTFNPSLRTLTCESEHHTPRISLRSYREAKDSFPMWKRKLNFSTN